jgi:hypothetical protein
MFVSLPPADQKLKESVEQTLASSGVPSKELEETRRRVLGDLGVSEKHRVIQFAIHEAEADKDVAIVRQTDGPDAVTVDPVSGNLNIVASDTGFFQMKASSARERFRHLFDVSE